MLYIKTKLSKWSGAKQKFLFAVVTLLSAPLWSDDVTQLRGCSLVKGAIFFKVQISLQTIKQAFASSHLQCLASLHLQLLQTNSQEEQCQLCVSLPWFCPCAGIPGAEITSCARLIIDAQLAGSCVSV